MASLRSTLALIFALAATSCASYPPLPTVQALDLERFMGDWYVVAHIPASSEERAYNAVESYALREDGVIETTYSFRDGGFEAPIEVLRPSAIVRDRETNATWGMRFFWPFRFEYLVTYLDSGYRSTIIGRTARDYAWIMTRDPRVSEVRMQELIDELRGQGYDVARLRRVPQRWPDPEIERARVAK